MSDSPERTSAPQGAPFSPRPLGAGSGVTLVLGGGGFRGMAHVGVLLALQRAGVAVDAVVGTSAGALMGAAFARIGDAQELCERVTGFVHSDDFRRKGFVGFGSAGEPANGVSGFVSRLFTGLKRQVALERMFRRSSAFGGAALRFVVSSLVPHMAIEELPLPLAIVAIDLENGAEVLMTSGDLFSAVVASSSVPGFFPPVEREGRLLADAGIVNNLPTRAARSLGATRVVAVDLSAGLIDAEPSPAVGMDVLLRAQDIATWHANRRLADLADLVLSPDLEGRDWLDPTDPAAVIAAGELAADAAMPRIRALLDRATWSG